MSEGIEAFRERVYLAGRELYRDLLWRRTRDPYAIWVSEAMLQQTQVSRVDGRWQSWLDRFPSVDALAAATSADVLAEWQGLGYNRRALALWRAAQEICEHHSGVMPQDEVALKALPGIGPATAAGIRAFAFDLSARSFSTSSFPAPRACRILPFGRLWPRRAPTARWRSPVLTYRARRVPGITRCLTMVRTSSEPYPTHPDAPART